MNEVLLFLALIIHLVWLRSHDSQIAALKARLGDMDVRKPNPMVIK